MILTESDFRRLFRSHLTLPHIESEKFSEILRGDDPGCGRLTALLLYCLVLEHQPRHVIEFSPASGFSSAAIALAMKRLGFKNSFTTFEWSELKQRPRVEARFDRLDINDYVRCIWGDALTNIPQHIQEKNIVGQVDFCFVDSGHSREFAERYIREVFPLLSDDCVIVIHDISAACTNPQGFFETNMYPGSECILECEAVREWVQKHDIDYTLTHAIFGGKEERSANLPLNKEIYNLLDDILEVDFLKLENKQPMCMVCKNVKT